MAEYLHKSQWDLIAIILSAQLSSVPPKGIVAAAIEQKQTDVLLVLVEMYAGLASQELSPILSYALSSEYHQNKSGFTNQLIQTVVFNQKISFVLDLSAAELQEFFTELLKLFQSNHLLSSIHNSNSIASILEWICFVLDSNPQMFCLDVKMKSEISKFSKTINSELENSKLLGDIGVALEVIEKNEIPLTQEQADYSVEYFAFK